MKVTRKQIEEILDMCATTVVVNQDSTMVYKVNSKDIPKEIKLTDEENKKSSATPVVPKREEVREAGVPGK